MPRDASFHDYVVDDLMSGIPNITSRAMFGGWGIYKDGKIFAIIADGELYFKVGDGNRADYERAGSRPFTYEGKGGKSATMSYWRVPAEVMEDREQLREWVATAVAVRRASKKKK